MASVDSTKYGLAIAGRVFSACAGRLRRLKTAIGKLGLPGWLLGIARGLALVIGGFALLNVLGQVWTPGFDANIWWIDLRPANPLAGRILLTAAAVFLLAYALRPVMSARRRVATWAAAACLLAGCVANAAQFYLLLGKERIQAGCPIAFSIFVSAALAVVFAGLMMQRRAPAGKRAWACMVVVPLGCLLAFPIGQMYCFGKTDYQRPAEAIVVFGSRVYDNGQPSGVVADRMRTACELFNRGLAHRLILSGGPGDGAVHETEAMRQMAVELGVPKEAILADTEGLNTRATVRNTSRIFERLGIRRVLAVSHFYHLPRIKMAYQRQGLEVYTVPAKESFVLQQMPAYLCREVAALWVYYLRPLSGQ